MAHEKAAYGTKGEQDALGPAETVFQAILDSFRLPGSEKAAARIAQEGYGVLMAGGETTAKTISILMYFLIKTRGKFLRRLREELEVVMPDAWTRPSLKELENLPLLVSWLLILCLMAQANPLARRRP